MTDVAKMIAELEEAERAATPPLLSRRPLMSDIEAQDCELEYWNQQAEDYALVQIPCEDLRAIITRAWQAPAFNSAAYKAERAIDRLEYLALARAQNATDRNDAKSAGAAARAAIAALRPTNQEPRND